MVSSPPWYEDLDDDQISMILSCLANHQPLCCEDDGRVNRETITKDPAIRKRLDDHAAQAWGCRGDSPYVDLGLETKRLNLYFKLAEEDLAARGLGS